MNNPNLSQAHCYFSLTKQLALCAESRALVRLFPSCERTGLCNAVAALMAAASVQQLQLMLPPGHSLSHAFFESDTITFIHSEPPFSDTPYAVLHGVR